MITNEESNTTISRLEKSQEKTDEQMKKTDKQIKALSQNIDGVNKSIGLEADGIFYYHSKSANTCIIHTFDHVYINAY
ncbi:MAG: hypothetical protein Q9M36_14450 [Sulfurovum sp.]|nr:hypothetical protein [Sulfurovum sp.]